MTKMGTKAHPIAANPTKGTPQGAARHLARVARLRRAVAKGGYAPDKTKSLKAELKRREAQLEEAGVDVPETADAAENAARVFSGRRG